MKTKCQDDLNKQHIMPLTLLFNKCFLVGKEEKSLLLEFVLA